MYNRARCDKWAWAFEAIETVEIIKINRAGA